ncbi:MAG TPA: DUF1257 domain-containing protein [Aggregatilineales bacterium]|nr:DUF1257 domain-containing protein [Aggregatilineales bacterium]
MSHFTRVRTQLRDLQTVRRALEDLGYEVEEGRTVRGYGGQETDADLIVRTGSQYDLGFRQEGGAILMVADFWGLRVDREAFLNRLTQRYAYLTVLEQAQTQGWQSVTEETQPDGSIRLVMQRWE